MYGPTASQDHWDSRDEECFMLCSDDVNMNWPVIVRIDDYS